MAQAETAGTMAERGIEIEPHDLGAPLEGQEWIVRLDGEIVGRFCWSSWGWIARREGVATIEPYLWGFSISPAEHLAQIWRAGDDRDDE